MTEADRLHRIMLARCGLCWADSTKPCDLSKPGPLTEVHVLPGPVTVHVARVMRAHEKGLLAEAERC